MTERTGVVTMRGNPVTLLGDELKVGQKAPDFTASGATLNPLSLKDFGDGVKIVSVTPSLDTPICELQTKRFHDEIGKMKGARLVAVSMDLPFAQSRFCSLNGIENALVISDHRDASFGAAWGVLIKEVRLHARAVFVLDGENVVRYAEVLKETATHPDYDKALAAAKALLG